MGISYEDRVKLVTAKVQENRAAQTTYKRENPSQPSSKEKKKSISPIANVFDRLTVKDSNERSWLKKALLEDGIQDGDIAKTILATGADLREGMWTGAFGLVEGISDAAAMIAPVLLGTDKDKAKEFVAKDLYDEKSEVKKALAAAKGIQELYYQGESTGAIAPVDIERAKAIIDKDYKYRTTRLDKESVSGDKLDSVAQSGGQLLATSALGMAKVPWWLVSGASAAGGEAESAFKEGATYGEALGSAAISGAAEVLSEKLSGGIKFGGKALDDALVGKLSREVSNKFLRNALKFGMDVVGEGAEEVVTSLASEFGQWLTYRDEEELKDILFSEQAMDEKIEAFLSGALMGGVSSGSNIVTSKAMGVDATSGLTANEETVVNKIYKDRVAEAEKNGKVTEKQKNKIYDEVIEEMDRGEISVETIEDLLGGDAYREYKKAMDSKEDNAFLQQYESLGSKKGATPKENAQYTEMSSRAEEINNSRKALRSRLREEVSELVKGDRLTESYNQKALRGAAFKVDLTKVDEKQKAIYQKAMDSGVVNDSRRAHEFVDLVAKIASDKGVDFDFTNNERLAQSGFAVEGVQVNGYLNENGITINMQSAKALNSVVGHEITHVLEGTDMYNSLQEAVFEYAKSKGELTDKWKSMKALYKDLNNIEINKEITADLIGDYLFTDRDFINSLYSGNRNLFTKILDEVTYLCKIVTAGSKEARQLEKVKKAFADAYRAGGKAQNETKIQHSLSSISNSFHGNADMTTDEFLQSDYKQTEGYKKYVDQCLNNMRQTRANFNEAAARKEIEDSIDGIIQVAIAAKQAGYDIYDDNAKRTVKDSKDRLLFSSLERNDEYFTSSDISTICDKRKNFAEIYDEIVTTEEAMDVPKGKRFFDNVDNYFALHKIMADKGLTQPCRQCYVESMRKNLAPMANAFLRLVGETNPDNLQNDQLYHQKGKQKGQQKVNNAALRESVLALLDEYGMSASDLNVETLTTADGLAQLKIQAPMIYEAFNSFYGQSKPKMPKSATPFRFGELTALLTDEKGKIKQSLVNKINSTGGFRLQSYSDFQIQNYTDVLQVIYEAGTLGLNGHAYTKVPAFLDATKGTNLKRNISIFMYKDGDEWRVDRNDSFPYTLDEIYDIVRSDRSGNTSIIAVSQNNDMSAWIMANDMVGYGIPFHKSGLKMGTVRDTDVKTEDGRIVKGYSGTKDHTRQQTEVWAKSNDKHKALTKVSKGIDIYEFWDFENAENLPKNDLIEKNLKKYIDECDKAGYLPKFRDYVMKNGKILDSVLEYSKKLGYADQNATIDDVSFEYKGYRIPYGYYKFLGDFGMFTPDGKAAPQRQLSLKNYDFDKAVEFFSNSEELRRNEILQQFANGKEREKYRISNLTAEQLADIIKQRRREVAQGVIQEKHPDIAPTQFSLSKPDIAPVQQSASESDKVYLDAVNRGDNETAQKMVDEAAKTAGYETVVYHGTNADFTVFRRGELGIHVGSYEQASDRIADTKRSDGTDSKIMKLYAKLGKSFDIYRDYGDWHGKNTAQMLLETEEVEALAEYDETKYQEIEERLSEIARMHDGPYTDTVLREYLQELGWDSIGYENHWEGITDDYGADCNWSYIVFDPNEVKSADPVSYDDSGNVIPLSQRFNVKNDDIRYSLSDRDAVPGRTNRHDIMSEDVYYDPTGIAPVAPSAQQKKAVPVPVTMREPDAILSPKDRAKRYYFDEVMSLDKMPEEFRKKHGARWAALQRATENAQDLVVRGADGVKPLDEIFQRVVATNAFSHFELYMQHLLNMDAMSLKQRFGLKDKDVIGGITSEMSRQEAAKLESEYPEFKEIADDIYAYNRYLRNVLVQSGKITQETADLWEQRYPHYIPIKRSGFGNDFEVSELLSFMVENMEQVPTADNMDGFFKQIEETAPVKARKGSDLPIMPLFDTLAERAMQTYWSAAMTGADMNSLAPVRSDVKRTAPTDTAVQNDTVQSDEKVQIETEKSSDSNILDVDSEVMQKGRMNPIKWMQEYILDNGMVFERLAKKVNDRGLEADWNFTRNSWGAAQHLIGNGDPAKNIRPLKQIFTDVKKSGGLKAFYDYLAHERNLDSMTMRVRFGLPVNHSVMGRSAADSVEALYELNMKYPKFKALADEVFKYSHNLIDMMVDQGMVSQADADMMKEVSPHWVPLNKVDGKIQPVFKSMAVETLRVYHAMALNKFGVHLKNTLGTVVGDNRMDVGSFMNSVEKNGSIVRLGSNARFHTMTVLENGREVTFEITDEMYEAMKPTSDLLAASIPVLSHASTARRNLITAYSPWFTLKNAVRDVQEIIVNSQHAGATYANIPKAIREIRDKGEFYQEYVKHGGEQNTYFDTESGEFSSGRGIMNALETKTGLKYILAANNFVEMTPRLAEYIASREAGASVEVAMLDAARVTTNFGAGGKVTKFLNRNGATFLNASVQGALQHARNFSEAKQNGFKGWASLAARYAALGIPAAILNCFIWDDDEDYQKLPDYITNNYYIVWKYGEGSFVRLPKGRTAAVIQNAMEQVSNMRAGKADWNEFYKILAENIAPNNPLEDNIFAPVAQVAKNKTWYDEDLVPKRLQKIEDVTQRFDEKTSTLSIMLSKALEDSQIGDNVDLSPKQLHYLLDQYSGVLGDTILPFTTPKAEIASDFLPDKLFAPLKDIFTTDSVLNDRVTGDFYDTLEAVEAYASEEGAPKSVKLQSSILIGYNAEVSKLLQQQRDLQMSDLKDSEKHAKNRELKERINALQRKGLDEINSLKITGSYAESGDKRYNFDAADNRWYEIKPKNADGTDNYYYQNEQGFIEAFGLSPAEYWNNRERYEAAYRVSKHYDDPYFETVKHVLELDTFASYAVGLSQIYADKDSKGNPINGSRKKKVKRYIYDLNIPDIEKHILYKAEYNYENKGYNKAIRRYVDSLDISDTEKSLVLAELGLR